MRLIPALLLATAGMSANATSNTRQPFAFLEGAGTESDPWLIKTADDFRGFASVTQAQADVTDGKYFKLTSDLRFNDKVLTDSGELIADTANLEKWMPVGIYDWNNSSHAFKGEFDGDGHTE